MMEYIEKKQFDEERALYGSHGVCIRECRFDGEQDGESAFKVRAGFKQFIPETTKIIIAQRVASVEDADMIIVMENGSIEAIGSHSELIKSCEIYREIYQQQTTGGGNNE